MSTQAIELPFPLGGVQRRSANRRLSNESPPHTAWAVNVRAEGTLDRRLRGGSRPGLTKFTNTDYGTTIADIVSVTTGSENGTSDLLVVLADSVLNVTENGTNSTPVAYLTTPSGDRLLTPGGDLLVASTATAPPNGFLIVGQQKVYAVTSTAIVEFDPKTGNTNNLVASQGTLPVGMTFGAIYRNRMILSGQDNAIYASRLGDYTDWDFGAHYEDGARATAFQLALANEAGDKVTAVISHKDDYLICATRRSLWIVQGDPVTGRLERISQNVGIISAKAWVKTDDTIFFLSEEGPYRMQSNGSALEAVGQQSVPDELRGIDTSTTAVTLDYDFDRNAFHIYLRTAAGSDTHWLFEQSSQGFWPMQLPDQMSPLASCQHQGKLLLAGGDGFIRTAEGTDDDGTAIESHVLLGPVKLGSLDFYGLVNYLHGILGEDSGEVTWYLIVGDSADEATDNGKAAIELAQSGGDFSSYVKASGTWQANRSTTVRPRVRGMWAVLWLESSNQWALEGVTAQVSTAGRWR